MSVCKKCGTSYEGNFCYACGTPKEEVIYQESNYVLNKTVGEKKSKSINKLILIGSVICLLVIAIAIILVFQVEEKPMKMITEALEDSDYDEAFEIYDENKFEQKDVAKIEDMLSDEIENIKARYIDKEIGFDEAITLVDKLKKFELSELNVAIEDFEEFAGKLKESRNYYDLAEKFYESEEYKKAIDNYEQVWEMDPDYEGVVEKIKNVKSEYKEKALSEADEYIKKADYKNAVDVLEGALEVIEVDSDLNYQLTMCKEWEEEAEIEEVLAKANEHFVAGEYEKAINVLKGGLRDYNYASNISDKMSEYEVKILEKALAEAETVFETSGHLAAIDKLNEYSSLVGTKTEFVSELEYYKGLDPDWLSELDVFAASDDNEFIFKKGLGKDELGNEFLDYLEIYYDFDSSKGWYEYHVNKEYASFSGRIGYYGSTSSGKGMKFLVYADDILVYESATMYPKSEPITFNVDLTNVNFLKIEYVALDRKSGLIIDQLYLNKY